MPYADGIYPGWRKQSNYFINAKPQKPSINIGAWSCLERAIREEAMLLKEDLQVFTGAFDSSSFLESASGQIEVHKFWYKIVLKRQTGMAFISCNDENDICKDKLAKCCTDICVSTKWGILKTVQNKKVICCALNEFHNPKNNVPKIPETIGITQILVSARNPPAAAGA